LFAGGLARRSTPGFLFRFEDFRTFRQARNALESTQGRSSLTTEEAGKNAKHFVPTLVGTRRSVLVRKFCSRERIVERNKGELSAWSFREKASRGGDVPGKFYGQATKGVWWMPWRQKAMKDVASCDKPRGAASRL
jgi:hypothetical protein